MPSPSLFPLELDAVSEEERKRELRRRNLVLALVIVGLVVMFYVITVVRLGSF